MPLVNFKVSGIKFLKDKLVVSMALQLGDMKLGLLSASLRNPCWPRAVSIQRNLVTTGGLSEDGASEQYVAGLCDLEHLCRFVSTHLPFSIPWAFL